ncbi:hypothetical protein [Leifsonia sp. TF02-11]|uniref:hypothetical protein n=1 Tax=Leifsonia sp. TF02-11 TaxID=2815212 RepID=UPI001AA1B5BF|nr:hypothetical protein [Leifsonia sp. TF02-11]MBO1740479.1 hypothetical protein [Leifsonia sp. TF02-11]
MGDAGALALLLEDVGWHQRRARCLTVAAFTSLGVGVFPLIRLAVGLRSSPTEQDPWGPLDAFVILAGILLWAGAIAGFSAARRHARVAAALAVRQLVDEQGARVRLGRAAGEAASPARLRRLVERRGWRVIPVDELDERNRLAQLFIAARNRPGTRRERIDRFGPAVASRYARVVIVRNVVLGVLIAVCAAAGIVGVAALVAPGPSTHTMVTTAVVTLFTVMLLSPIVGVLLRRSPVGLLHLADTLLPQLLPRDAAITRMQVAAMLRKPRLYDVWHGLHSVDASGVAPG